MPLSQNEGPELLNQHPEARPTPSMSGLEVRDSRYGRGVFATKPFGAGDLIEAAPVVPITKAEARRATRASVDALERYWFIWEPPGDKDMCLCVALGFGGLYNHSATPNMSKVRDYDGLMILFYASRDIQVDEELLHDYGPNWSAEDFAQADAALQSQKSPSG